MRATVFEGVGRPLRLVERPVPEPEPGQLLMRVLACGVCRTDLHLLDGEVDVPHPPRVLGHQIVGEVQPGGRRVGVPWFPPEPLDAAIIFAPDGTLVPAALRAVRPSCPVVCGGIHMSDIPSFPYDILWGERTVRSVANLTRSDGHEFLGLAPQVPVHSRVTQYPLEEVNRALEDLPRAGSPGRR